MIIRSSIATIILASLGNFASAAAQNQFDQMPDGVYKDQTTIPATILVGGVATANIAEIILADGDKLSGCPGCPEMVAIPGKSYALGKYEVTQAEWVAVMGSNPSHLKGSERPVESVSWKDAQAYLAKLNELTGKQFRLPTDAEWEYACYSNEQTIHCGGNDRDAVAWNDDNSGQETHPVGQKLANGFGLYDMSGNVMEWVGDCWNGNCEMRVVRGGSWFQEPPSDSAALRHGFSIYYRHCYHVGLRLAVTLP